MAIFKMKKTNVLTADPVNAGQSIAIGGAESKGVEWDLAGHLPSQVMGRPRIGWTRLNLQTTSPPGPR